MAEKRSRPNKRKPHLTAVESPSCDSATLDPAPDEAILAGPADGADDAPVPIGMQVAFAVKASEYFGTGNSDAELADAEASATPAPHEPPGPGAPNTEDEDPPAPIDADSALAKLDDWDREMCRTTTSAPVERPVRRGSAAIPEPPKTPRRSSDDPTADTRGRAGRRRRWPRLAAGGAVAGILAVAIASNSGSTPTLHGKRSASTRSEVLATAAIHRLGAVLPRAVDYVAAAGRPASARVEHHRVSAPRRGFSKRRRSHRIGRRLGAVRAAAAHPAATSAKTAQQTQPTQTAPAPTSQVVATPQTGVEASGGSGGSGSSGGSHTATTTSAHRPAFGANGTLGPGHSPSG